MFKSDQSYFPCRCIHSIERKLMYLHGKQLSKLFCLLSEKGFGLFGNKLFPFRVDPFSEVYQTALR